MGNRYEISVWEDTYMSDENGGHYNENKLFVIGSDTMDSQFRAQEPKLVTKMDGTAVFTFNMYSVFIDNMTGEEVANPYIKYLVNERKIKVYWKNKWYDLLIKDIKEDAINRVFSYSCEDAYITELSRSGFSLEFETELQNNIGTAPELIGEVLKGTDWQFKPGDKVYSTTQESVYETVLLTDVRAYKDPYINSSVSQQTTTLMAGHKILVFFSNIADRANLPTTCQFSYLNGTEWECEDNSMLVTNGECYHINNIVWTVNDTNAVATLKSGNQLIDVVQIELTNGLSSKYIATRYINAQKTRYSKILGRYVNVYSDSNNVEYLGYQTTTFNSPLNTTNLISNPKNYSNIDGWLGKSINITYNNTSGYETSYINFPSNSWICNTGIVDNQSFITDGFIQGEEYVFKIRFSGLTGTTQTAVLSPTIAKRDIGSYVPINNTLYTPYTFFTPTSSENDGTYLIYHLTCIRSCPVSEFHTADQEMSVFIQTNITNTWQFEDIQLFKAHYNSDQELISPNDTTIQGASSVVWKYYLASEENNNKTPETLNYAYTSTSEWSNLTPLYNTFEKVATIKESQSNRFNLLQTIAETFECWIRFEINHDETGAILRGNDGKLEKYVTVRNSIGNETGVNFVYGLDLKGLTRDIKSSDIATKIIVLQNENEFGKNGFCSIARSPENYIKENFIYDFSYYISQGLLNQEQLNNDLYGANGYFYKLNQYNTEYDNITEELVNIINEQSRQQAAAELYSQYITAADKQVAAIEERIIKLANTTSFNSYSTQQYISTNQGFTEITSLQNSRSQILSTKRTYQTQLNNITGSLNTLSSSIANKQDRQAILLEQLEELHSAFQTKYARFIQEGTWSSQDYWDDTEYYLDALKVAKESAHPQISYDISVLRLSDFEEFSSKIFDLGDICTVQDTKYFGYLSDGITPYKEQVYISEITSFFDTPDKDSFKVQNYKDNFEDLFQRITAATQSLKFAEGKYSRAAGALNSNGTIKSSVIQSTFDNNRDLVMGALNETVLIDNKGITVSDQNNAASLVRVTSGGIFVSQDGGVSWKNAVKGDGISADALTAGIINTEQINIYNGDNPSFVWDKNGISAFKVDNKVTDLGTYKLNNKITDLGTYVRFDKYGLYGVQGKTESFVPADEPNVWENASFGLTWNGFFIKNKYDDGGSVEISSNNDILVKQSEVERIKIGHLEQNNYGITIKNGSGEGILTVDTNGLVITGGFTTKSTFKANDTGITISNGTNTMQIGAGGITIYGSKTRYLSIGSSDIQIVGNDNYLKLTDSSIGLYKTGTTDISYFLVDSDGGKIEGGVQLGGALTIYNTGFKTKYGSIGYMEGTQKFTDGTSLTTTGIAMVRETPKSTDENTGVTTSAKTHYLVVTDSGIRLQEHLDNGQSSSSVYLADGRFVINCERGLTVPKGQLVSNITYNGTLLSRVESIWLNSKPTSSFASQEITDVRFQHYDILIFEIAWSTSYSSVVNSAVVYNGSNIIAQPSVTWYNDGYVSAAYRQFTINGAKITIGSGCHATGTSVSTSDDTYAIPIRIMGIMI